MFLQDLHSCVLTTDHHSHGVPLTSQERTEKDTYVRVHHAIGGEQGWVDVVAEEVIGQWAICEGDVGVGDLWKLRGSWPVRDDQRSIDRWTDLVWAPVHLGHEVAGVTIGIL